MDFDLWDNICITHINKINENRKSPNNYQTLRSTILKQFWLEYMCLTEIMKRE